MHKILLFCGLLMTSSMTFADDATVETCANGAGTVLTGAVTGQKYCKGNKAMNWWNANSWCDGMGMKLFSLNDCACSETTANCAGNHCPELKNTGVKNTAIGARDGSTSSTHAIHIGLIDSSFAQHWTRASTYGWTPLCK
jgi:hypothetical protein